MASTDAKTTELVSRFRPYYFDPRNLTGHPATMRENAEGEYVRWTDYMQLRMRYEALQRELAIAAGVGGAALTPLHASALDACGKCGGSGRLTIYDDGGFGQLRSPIGDEPCPSCNADDVPAVQPLNAEGWMCACGTFNQVDNCKNCGWIRPELPRTSPMTVHAMKQAGFTWDPSPYHARWTHFVLDITCLRQPYMNDAQWEAEQERCIKLADNKRNGVSEPAEPT